jgi:hypothetical protein
MPGQISGMLLGSLMKVNTLSTGELMVTLFVIFATVLASFFTF